MDIVSDIILVVAVVIVYVVFPLWAAHHASRRGHKRWAKIAVLSTLLGLGLFGGLAALWAARKSVEEAESQPKTEADRIRSRGRTLALVAGVGVTLAVMAVMALTVVVPMSNRAVEQSLGDPRVSAIESMEAMSSASSLGVRITGFVSIGAGLATLWFVRNHFNDRANAAEREADTAT